MWYDNVVMKRKLIILTVILLTQIPVFANNYQNVYNEAWEITSTSFYDSSMNNQDWNYWKKHYAGKIKTQDDLKVAIDTMLASLNDVYTRYLPETDFTEEKNEIHDENTSSISNKPIYVRTHIPKHIKYIYIESMFNKSLAQEIKDAITEAEKDPKLKGYILDFRNNGGGLVKNATDIASLFMNDKVVLYAKTNSKNLRNKTEPNDCITDKKVVLIINNYTASACEVFTGTMQDNKRAYIVGQRSFGKGVIQQIRQLPDNEGGIHVTVMSYYTPDFKQINKNGIEPDKEVFFTRKDVLLKQDVQLKEAIKYLNRNSDDLTQI